PALPENPVLQLPEREPEEEIIEVKPVEPVVEEEDAEPRTLSTEVHLDGAVHLTPEGWGQFELVVGEIYRRLGYSVAISAGLGVEDEVVLRIARDWQTRLVYCRRR